MAHHRQLCNEYETTDPDLLAHLAALGLKTTDDYTEWCARHGFSRRLNKHWRQRLKERSLHTEAICLARLSQKHCVGSYARSCARGTKSIWTLEAETDEGRAKLLTIEVRNAANLICQARGKFNAMPAEKHRNILRRWAETAGLILASYV